MKELVNVKFLNAGYCRQSARWTKSGAWQWTKFHAIVVYFEHPQHGAFLIDTGYSLQFWEATQQLPYRVYRWIIPPRIDKEHCLRSGLAAAGIEVDNLAGVFLSHYHPDHLGGLKDLPKTTTIILRPKPLEALQRMKPLKQLHHGFIPGLFNSDHHESIVEINESSFDLKNGTELLSDFQHFDYWGDGSLCLADLPGHSLGHFGFLLRTDQGSLFYIVDAAWNLETIQPKQSLPYLSRLLQHDYSEYADTQRKLHNLTTRDGLKLVACHCPSTQLLAFNR